MNTDNIPPHILADIRRKAALDHPGDYSTQLYVVNTQCDAYRELIQLEIQTRIYRGELEATDADGVTTMRHLQ
jgi:hypothetical protein